MTVKSFTIGGKQYNAAMAAAVDQDRLLSLLGNGLIQRFVMRAGEGKPLEDSVLVTMLMSMDHPTKAQVAEILMCRVLTPAGEKGSVPVTVRDFGGQMVHYNQLLAELLRWNLADFFDWLPSVLKNEAEAAAGQEAR